MVGWRRRATVRITPLARMIQEHIKKPLAEELLFGKLAKGGVVRVDVSDENKLIFTYPEDDADSEGDAQGDGHQKEEPAA